MVQFRHQWTEKHSLKIGDVLLPLAVLVVAKLASADCSPSHRKCLLFLIHRGPVIRRDPNKLRMKMNFK